MNAPLPRPPVPHQTITGADGVTRTFDASGTPIASESQLLEWADEMRERADWSARAVSLLFWIAFLTAAGTVLALSCR